MIEKVGELQKIIKASGSYRVTLPRQIFYMLGWKESDKIRIKISDGGNLILINVSLESEDERKKDFFR